MPVTLLALYRRPEGGDKALETFRRRYAEEHLPLVRDTPGLRTLQVESVVHAFGESDLVLVARMGFDDRAALDAGLGSDAMRRAGRNLREIAPGLSTLLVVQEDDTMSGQDGSTATDGGTHDEPAEGRTDDGGGSGADRDTRSAGGGTGSGAAATAAGASPEEPAEGRSDADAQRGADREGASA
jgi:uncharacterized protein (TIGR02118 family)